MNVSYRIAFVYVHNIVDSPIREQVLTSGQYLNISFFCYKFYFSFYFYYIFILYIFTINFNEVHTYRISPSRTPYETNVHTILSVCLFLGAIVLHL